MPASMFYLISTHLSNICLSVHPSVSLVNLSIIYVPIIYFHVPSILVFLSSLSSINHLLSIHLSIIYMIYIHVCACTVDTIMYNDKRTQNCVGKEGIVT